MQTLSVMSNSSLLQLRASFKGLLHPINRQGLGVHQASIFACTAHSEDNATLLALCKILFTLALAHSIIRCTPLRCAH